MGAPRSSAAKKSPSVWRRLSAARSKLSFKFADEGRQVRFQHSAKVAQLHDIQAPDSAFDITHE